MTQTAIDEITTEPRHWPVGLREYHADLICESNSTLKQFLEDRRGYYLERVLKQPRSRSTHATDLGTAFHVFLTQPDLFDDEVYFLPDGVTRRSEKGQRLMLDRPHQAVLEQHDMYKLERMKSSVMNNEACVELLQQEDQWDIEHAVRMIHEPSGIPIKVCFDGLHSSGRIRDLKTSANPSLHGYKSFRDALWEFGYYRQAPLYCMVRDAYRPFVTFEEPGPDADQGYDWIVVGNEEPFESYRYRLGPATRELGQWHNDLILEKLAACKFFAGGTDDPGPWRDPNHGRTVMIDLPEYRFRKELTL